MDWYRVFHGLPYDARLAVTAHRAGLSRAEALALYITLFDHASQARPRGSLARFDTEEAGLALGLDACKIEAALEALREKGVITASGRIADWRRQDPPSTARVRAHRLRGEGRQQRRERMREKAQPRPEDSDSPAAVEARRLRLLRTATKKERACNGGAP